jgi:hypothetical protein
LYARPRFKDLAGHPALLLSLWLASRQYVPRLFLLALFLVGVIGQASFLNAFCHIHTPLLNGIARALLGLGFGVIIGIVLYFLFRFAERRLNRVPSGVHVP